MSAVRLLEELRRQGYQGGYRTVDAEGFISYGQNRYSAPWHYIGQVLSVRITDEEVTVYDPRLEVLARHRRFPPTERHCQSRHSEHLPPRDVTQRREALRQRFADLGPLAVRFLELIFGEPATRSRRRTVERRIRDAKFHEDKNLEGFDWAFNAAAIDRTQIEQFATGEFVRRGENLVMVGQSGVGKSHLLQALGKRLCELGYRVRYATSAELLQELRASLADQSLPRCIRAWSRFDLVIIDEFGFDRIERNECPEAANLFYKLIDARSGKRSTALGTNIDLEKWADYLGDPPLALAFLDRVVYRATALKICGKSYRAHRAKKPSSGSKSDPS